MHRGRGGREGRQGYHYINESLYGSVDPAKPTALLYEDGEDGVRRLVGAEWIVPATDAKTPRPTLFGQDFEGPTPGHNAAMPTYYDVHAWIWKSNPSGMFAPWNPTVKCPAPGAPGI